MTPRTIRPARTTRHPRRGLARATGVLSLILATTGLAACSSSDEPAPPPKTPLPAYTVADPALVGLAGPGCAAYAAQHRTGKASIFAMAATPLATALGNNPSLTQLSRAVSGELNRNVKLSETLNGGEFTVFAPVDSAFADLTKVKAAALKKDRQELVKVLTYHVVTGRIGVDEIVGKQKSVEGGDLKVAKAQGGLTVDGAHVICGGLRTANATVYLIDKVLTPSR